MNVSKLIMTKKLQIFSLMLAQKIEVISVIKAFLFENILLSIYLSLKIICRLIFKKMIYIITTS